MPTNISRFTKEYRKYYKRLHAKVSKKGLAKIESGSAEISSEGYALIAKRLAEMRGVWSAPLFWTGLWNVVARGVSVGSLTVEVLVWKDDCLRLKLWSPMIEQQSDDYLMKVGELIIRD